MLLLYLLSCGGSTSLHKLTLWDLGLCGYVMKTITKIIFTSLHYKNLLLTVNRVSYYPMASTSSLIHFIGLWAIAKLFSRMFLIFITHRVPLNQYFPPKVVTFLLKGGQNSSAGLALGRFSQFLGWHLKSTCTFKYWQFSINCLIAIRYWIKYCELWSF